ncbi:MAG: hypothetical protein GTN65_08225 [Armatimonadetes bacterium]|nr:hypothetical protein [Armatimonadota bacterium]NIO97070.1 hypothetical protein [Armatimonadota bacterium]
MKIDLPAAVFSPNGGLTIYCADGHGLLQATCQVLDAMSKDEEWKVRELAIEMNDGRQLAAILSWRAARLRLDHVEKTQD